MDSYKVLSTKRLGPSLMEQAKKSGVEVLEREFISVEPLLSDEVFSQIKPWIKKSEPSFAVFTSANGVEAVAAHLQRLPAAPAPNWKVFCISGKTREAVTSVLPHAPVLATAENGVTLARHILETGGVHEVVFFCGNKRREELPAILTAAGIRVHEIVVYHTEEMPCRVEEDLDGVLFYSPSGVQSFFSANQLKKDAVCFAIGRTTAEAVAAHTSHQIITSEAPSTEAMLAAVLRYFQTINCKK